jgi:hypothetical protein
MEAGTRRTAGDAEDERVTGEEAGRRQQIAVRLVLARMRTMARAAALAHVEILRLARQRDQSCAELVDQREAARRLGAKRRSHTFRLARLVRSIASFVMPTPTPPVSAANPALPGSESPDFSPEILDWLGQCGPGGLPYAPLSWPRKNGPPSPPRSVDLVILSPVHRSGSTLLQRICNSRKGTLIWGEHGGLLAHFANIYASAAYFSTAGGSERADYFGQGENPNLWIADMCPELGYAQAAVVESARAFLGAFYGQYREGHDILGFKEVHYGREELELIRACCPATEIVLLVRNPLDTWRSTPRGWYLSLDEWAERWRANVEYFTAFAAADAHCRLLRYEDLVAQEPRTLAALAEVAKVSRPQAAAVLAHKIGSNDAGLSAAEWAAILDRCRGPMTAMGYL